MQDDIVGRRIEAWTQAGIIDEATAERLRAAERAATAVPAPAGARSAAAAFFGPTPSVTEVFAYVGGGFLLAAWHTLVSTWLDTTVGYEAGRGSWGLTRALEFAVPAAVLFALGWFASRRSERARRAAGVAFAAAVVHAYGAADLALADGTSWQVAGIAGGVAATLTGLAARSLHRSVLAQVGLLGGAIALSASTLTWAGDLLWPDPCSGGYPCTETAVEPATAWLKVSLSLGWWILTAVVFGLLALREARVARRLDGAGDDEGAAGAGRRANVTRLAAGLVGVVGATAAVMQSGPTDAYGGWGRLVPAIAGDAAIALVAVVLLWLAIRRGAAAYLYPAALGLIVALSDLNGSVIAERTGTGIALLIEGLILIGAGVLADRIRRRLAGPGGPPAGTASPAPA